MKKVLLITTSLAVFLLMFFLFSKSVFADGMMIYPDPYSDRWDYSNESNQQAFINYENGLQKMIISVGIDEEKNNGLVWLFPIPADPDKVVIEVTSSLPALFGEEISEKAKSNFDSTTKYLHFTQLYPFPFESLYEVNRQMDDNSDWEAKATSLGFGGAVEQDVVVYEHLEKQGIVSEIITAKTASGLYDYLKGKGLKIESGSLPVLNNYIGKDFSFVASWIIPTGQNETTTEKVLKTNEELVTDVPQDIVDELVNNLKNNLPGIEKYFEKNPRDVRGYITTSPEAETIVIEYLQKNRPDWAYKEITVEVPKSSLEWKMGRQKGVFVTFPTKDIYFPLMPTSVYGSETVPASIRVIGHVSPKIFKDIKGYTDVKYYVDNYVSFSDDLNNFYKGKDQDLKYTKIDIEAPSKFLTDDLWIGKHVPIKTYYPAFAAKHPLISGIILLALSSIITSILAGIIIFKDLRKKPIKLGLIGISNCLTILGLIVATFLVGTKHIDENVSPLLSEIKSKGYFWKRKTAAALFSAAILFLVFGLFILASQKSTPLE